MTLLPYIFPFWVTVVFANSPESLLKIYSTELVCTERDLQFHAVFTGPLTHPLRVFVKDKHSDPHCSVSLAQNRSHNALVFNVPLSTCGMQRIQRDTTHFSFATTVVVSFHRLFVTDRDRSFRISCDYSNRKATRAKEVTAAMGIRDMPDSPLEDVPLEVIDCAYKLYKKDKNGLLEQMTSPVLVGDRIIHQWKCTSLSPDQFIFVHNCTVSPEYFSSSDPLIVDNSGCTQDRTAMGPLEYSTDGSTATGEHNAYKFSDHPNLLYRCSISLCRRSQPTLCVNEGGQPITLPPRCDSSTSDRYSRHVTSEKPNPAYQSINGSARPTIVLSELLSLRDPSSTEPLFASSSICVPFSYFAVILSIACAMMLTAGIWVILNRRSKQN